MQVIDMHLVSESVWDDTKEVFYLVAGGDTFFCSQSLPLQALKELDTYTFYVFEHPPTEEGFLGVDLANQTFVFATKHPAVANCYNYFVTDLDTLKGKGNYNPFAGMASYVTHFQKAGVDSYFWRKPFVVFGKGGWFPVIPAVSSPKPKYKWTLTRQGVAFQ